jgi:hypothetical protein
MIFEPNQEVNYKGTCYKIARQEPDGRWRIYPRRRSGWNRHIQVVAGAELSPWAQPVKDRSKAQTCQICARRIMASKGKIAHHGYERPQGWHEQTGSCYGARELPFERDCSVLRRYIAEVLRRRASFLTERLATLEDPHAMPLPMVAGPSERLKDHRGEFRYDGRGRAITHNPAIGPEHAEYAHYRRRAVDRVRAELEALTEETEHQEKRLADWRPA